MPLNIEIKFLEVEMKRLLGFLMTLVIVVGLFAGCSSGKTEPTPGTSAPPTGQESKDPAATGGDEQIVLSIAHVNASSDTDQLHHYITQTKAKLEELSGGTMTMDIYGDASLGTDKELFEMCSYGTLDMTANGTSTCNGGVDEFQLFEMPYLFPEGDPQARAFLADDGGTLDFIRERWEQDWNVKLLDLMDAGFRNLMGSGEPMTDPTKTAGMKIRTSDNVIIKRIIELIGGIPTNMAWTEMYTAYQQGVLDAGEWPIFSAYHAGFQEVTEWCVRSEFYPLIIGMTINVDRWDSLTEEQQGWLTESIDYGREEAYKLIDELGNQYFEEITADGCVVYTIDKEPFIQAVEPIWDEFRDYFGGDFIDEVRAQIDSSYTAK